MQGNVGAFRYINFILYYSHTCTIYIYLSSILFNQGIPNKMKWSGREMKQSGQNFSIMLQEKFNDIELNVKVLHMGDTESLDVKCHMSHVPCHQCQQPWPQTFLLLTLPLCTVGWITETPQNFSKLKAVLAFAILVIHSLNRCLQSIRLWVLSKRTNNKHIHPRTTQLNQPRG